MPRLVLEQTASCMSLCFSQYLLIYPHILAVNVTLPAGNGETKLANE